MFVGCGLCLLGVVWVWSVSNGCGLCVMGVVCACNRGGCGLWPEGYVDVSSMHSTQVLSPARVH